MHACTIHGPYGAGGLGFLRLVIFSRVLIQLWFGGGGNDLDFFLFEIGN